MAVEVAIAVATTLMKPKLCNNLHQFTFPAGQKQMARNQTRVPTIVHGIMSVTILMMMILMKMGIMTMRMKRKRKMTTMQRNPHTSFLPGGLQGVRFLLFQSLKELGGP
ncbi:hypothetical protein ACLB2K_031928 [Fragaria x ananassa]